MSDELPTLQDIARRTLWIEGVGLSEQAVSNALLEAGMDPDDQNERERFLRLVKANYYYQHGEIAAVLGTYFDRAMEDLGRDVPQDELLRRAIRLAEDDRVVDDEELRGDQSGKTNPDR